jgi:alpha-1,2-mannosyltransferase
MPIFNIRRAVPEYAVTGHANSAPDIGLTPWLRLQRLSQRPIVLLVGAAVLMATSITAYVAVSTLMRQPFYVGFRHLDFFDLRIYRGAAWRITHGKHLYGLPIRRELGFTYPPVAALLFWPLNLVSFKADQLWVTIVNLAALVWMLRRTLEIARRSLPHVGRALSRPIAAWTVALLATAAAIWLEPVSVALGYGQVDLLIAALVIFDISRPDSAKTKGIAIGIAAGLKLTPLMFVPYLLLSRRPRAALTAALTFSATVAVSFIVTPADATRYWGNLILRSSRVGTAPAAGNQSLRGAIARLAGTLHPGEWSFLVIAAVAVIGITVAVAASRRGNEPAGFSLCAITTLLCSPVSWTHHWVLAVPGLLLLFLVAYERRSWWLLFATGALLSAGYAYLPERTMREHVRLVGGAGTLNSDPYVLIGLVILAIAAAVLIRTPRRQVGPLPA